MMKTKSITLGIAIVVVLTACSDLTVVSDQNPEADFSKYQTYALVNKTAEDEPQSVVNNPINMGRFESELTGQLLDRGLSQSEEPDVILSYAVAQDERTSYSGTTTDMGGGFYGGRWGRGWYGAGPNMSTTQINEQQIPIGTANIALIDAESGELLWYTTISGDLKINQKKVGKGIPKAVEALLQSFPIEPVMAQGQDQPV